MLFSIYSPELDVLPKVQYTLHQRCTTLFTKGVLHSSPEVYYTLHQRCTTLFTKGVLHTLIQGYCTLFITPHRSLGLKTTIPYIRKKCTT